VPVEQVRDDQVRYRVVIIDEVALGDAVAGGQDFVEIGD